MDYHEEHSILKSESPIRLFIPRSDCLGAVHAMSFKEGILVDCRIIRPSFNEMMAWITRTK